MRTRDNGKCEFCEGDLTGLPYEETHTTQGRDFCSYACLEAFHGDELPENEEEFIG